MSGDDRGMGSALRCCVALLATVAVGACSSATVVRTSGSPGASTAPRASAGKPGASVTVRRGDTLYAIARSNNVNPQDLAAWNRLAPPYTIYPGQSLRLYPPGASASGGGASTAPRGTAPVQAPPSTGAGAVARPTPAAPTPPASSGFSWRWPAEGVVVGRFVGGEATKQGVDIAGSNGQAVRAAADGVVVYSGAGLVGYGELIIIKHNEQWLSAYGHNRKRLVNEGQNVKAGEQIAEMGRSGAARDMLHFEIRYNGKPVDPLLYLPNK